MSTAQVIADFNELADLVEPGQSGIDHYDEYLLSLVPIDAQVVLDIGCGLGRLTRSIASNRRRVIGVDISPRMVERARVENTLTNVSFVEGDFLTLGFNDVFDCVISAAALHHMSHEDALPRMSDLVRPGGRLIIHDLRCDSSLGDLFRSSTSLSRMMLMRLFRTGRLRKPKQVRQAWDRHGAHEKYLSFAEAKELAELYFDGSAVKYHWLWRYTIVWEKSL